MTVNDPTDPATDGSEEQHHAVARKNREAHFSDSEWKEVKSAA